MTDQFITNLGDERYAANFSHREKPQELELKATVVSQTIGRSNPLQPTPVFTFYLAMLPSANLTAVFEMKGKPSPEPEPLRCLRLPLRTGLCPVTPRYYERG